MKTTIITLSFAAQLIAFGAFAQTSGTSATETSSATFGSDWSTSLGSAMFGEDGTTVRPSAELTTQWATLSEEDKTMLQRDCMAYTQQSDSAAGTTGAATDTTAATGATATADGSTTTGTAAGSTAATGSADTTTGTTTGSATPMNVTMEQMEEICAATKDM